jgi:hypothetical protein
VLCGSLLLNSTKYGFVIKEKWKAVHTISHLLYMDDLKIYAATDTQLKHMINIVRKFSEDIGMTFGLDKCKTVHINKGKLINNNEEDFPGIQAMTIEEEEYNYLGIKQVTSTDHTNIKKDITKQFQERLIALLKTELNGKTSSKPLILLPYQS